jgi:hypothetical protein
MLTKLADHFDQTVILSAICNGCNNHGGAWSFDDAVSEPVPKKKHSRS